MDEDRHREFREFFAPRLPRLLGLAYLLCGDATEAEDLTQIALARAFVAWRRVRDSDHPDAYVRRILVNANRRRLHPALHSESVGSPKPPDRGRHHKRVASAHDIKAHDSAA
ncbi:sigma factor [Frankia gtarii]|uniref:sigma factor n=1 Tax=Frankia gtarii TaxID=2950102 RepID=UPI003F682E6B